MLFMLLEGSVVLSRATTQCSRSSDACEQDGFPQPRARGGLNCSELFHLHVCGNLGCWSPMAVSLLCLSVQLGLAPAPPYCGGHPAPPSWALLPWGTAARGTMVIKSGSM